MGYNETIAYNMPSYVRAGAVEVAFAKQSRYLSVYFLTVGLLDAHSDVVADINRGKGCIRFSRPDTVDFSVIDVLLAATANSTEPPC